jgi:hypothetical protein
MADESVTPIESPDVPDIFADSLNFSAGPYGFTVSLFRSVPQYSQPQPSDTVIELVARVRFAPELAAALVPLLESALEQHRAAMAARESAPEPAAKLPKRDRKAMS